MSAAQWWQQALTVSLLLTVAMAFTAWLVATVPALVVLALFTWTVSARIAGVVRRRRI